MLKHDLKYKTLLEFMSSAVNSGEKQMAPGIPPMFSRYVEFLFTPIPHSTKNPIYVFPEMKLCGLVPNAYIHVSVSDLCIPRIGLHIWLQHNTVDRPILGI